MPLEHVHDQSGSQRPWVDAPTRLRQLAKALRIQVTNQWAEHRWAELISADPSKAVRA